MAPSTSKSCRQCRTSRQHCIKSEDRLCCQSCVNKELKCSLVTEFFIEARQTPVVYVSAADSLAVRRPSAYIKPGESEITSKTSVLYRNLLMSKCRLHLGLDIGTSKSSVMFQVLENEVRSTSQTSGISMTLGDDHRIPAEAAIMNDDGDIQLIFGHKVQTSINNGDIDEKDVFRYLKLTLLPVKEQRFKGDATAITELHAAHKAILRTVSSKTVRVALKFDDCQKLITIKSTEDILCQYLRWLWDQCKTAFQAYTNLNKEDVARVFKYLVKVAVSVPAIWTDKMIDRLRSILLDAGIPNIHIRSEPKCAAASVASEAQKEISNLPPAVMEERIQQIRLVIAIYLDLGCGTAVSHPPQYHGRSTGTYIWRPS